VSRIQEVNLQDILSIAQTSSTRRANGLLRRRGNDSKYLRKLLRNHIEEPVGDAETHLRDDIDNLIALYSVLEIACIARFVPEPLPPELRALAATHLGNSEVKRYYTQNYPQELPQSFYRRVSGESAPKETEGPDLPGQFLRFLETTREFEGDADMEMLLTFLDDYVIDGYDWSNVAKIVQSPERFCCVLSDPQSEDEIVASAVFGYWKFVSFCNNLHELLDGLDKRVLLQSAVWHYYEYWFRLLKDKVGPALKRSLASIKAMLPKMNDFQESRIALASIEAQRAVLEDLLSDRYSKTLRGTPLIAR
jgi:hypothetical protein